MNYLKALLIGGFALVEFALGAQSALLRDTFDDQLVDEVLWNVVRPYTTTPRSTVTESNSTLVLFRRGIVEATGSFPASLDIEGKFRFTGDNDVLSIVFRSDLTVTNQFERRGVPSTFRPSWSGLKGECSSHMMQRRLQVSGLVSTVMRQGPGSELSCAESRRAIAWA